MNLYIVNHIFSFKVEFDQRRIKARLFERNKGSKKRRGDLVRSTKDYNSLLVFDKGETLYDANRTISKYVRVDHNILPDHWKKHTNASFFLSKDLGRRVIEDMKYTNFGYISKIRIGKHRYLVMIGWQNKWVNMPSTIEVKWTQNSPCVKEIPLFLRRERLLYMYYF